MRMTRGKGDPKQMHRHFLLRNGNEEAYECHRDPFRIKSAPIRTLETSQTKTERQHSSSHGKTGDKIFIKMHLERTHKPINKKQTHRAANVGARQSKKRGMGGNITFKQSLRSHDDDKTAYITKQHFLNETANREYIGTASEQPSRVQTRLTGHFCIGHKHRLKEEEGGREDPHRLAPFA